MVIKRGEDDIFTDVRIESNRGDSMRASLHDNQAAKSGFNSSVASVASIKDFHKSITKVLSDDAPKSAFMDAEGFSAEAKERIRNLRKPSIDE